MAERGSIALAAPQGKSRDEAARRAGGSIALPAQGKCSIEEARWAGGSIALAACTRQE